MMKRMQSAVVAVMMRVAIAAAITIGASCAGVGVPQAQRAPKPAGASMWIEPADLASRDLFYGPWGKENAPDPDGVYQLVELKHSGVNLGMTVKDEKGREWSVKQPFPGGLDPEGPVEVALSRLLSAVGYHQPPIYYLPAFYLEDDFGKRVAVGGRFRLKHESLKDVGSWKWEENPFVGTKEYQGLLVLLTMFNSTDLKNQNNTLYERRNGDLVEQWYVARDLGAALGDWNPLAPRKNHPETFESTPYILGVSNGHVEFAYNGWYKNLVRDRITREDVAWASNLLGRLSPKQWQDAFRAAGYQPATANRFIARLREKIAEGKALSSRAADR
jgi:hypothetical protein